MLNFSSLFNKTLVTKDYENFQIKFKTEYQIKYLIKIKRINNFFFGLITNCVFHIISLEYQIKEHNKNLALLLTVSAEAFLPKLKLNEINEIFFHEN